MAFVSGRHVSITLGTLAVLFLCGGIVFSLLERKAELQTYKKNQFFYQQMRSMYEFKHCKESWFQDMEFCKNQEEFHVLLKEFFARNDNNLEDQQKWTIFGSIFFVMTLVTTLGYGSLHPITPHGMVFTIFFGLIGIPTMTSSAALAPVGPDFHRIFLRWRDHLVALEGWTLVEAVYFSACTMMTIGFGNVLPTYVGSKIFTMIFIVCTLGFGASLIASLTHNVEVQGRKFADWYGAHEQSSNEKSRTGQAETHA